MNPSPKSVFQLMDSGIAAFRGKRYGAAIEILTEVIDLDPQNWQAKLYLAMTYFQLGESFTAHRHFRFLVENATDPEIRGKAQSALAALQPRINKAGGTQQLPAAAPRTQAINSKEQQRPAVRPSTEKETDAADLETISTTSEYYRPQ